MPTRWMPLAVCCDCEIDGTFVMHGDSWGVWLLTQPKQNLKIQGWSVGNLWCGLLPSWKPATGVLLQPQATFSLAGHSGFRAWRWRMRIPVLPRVISRVDTRLKALLPHAGICSLPWRRRGGGDLRSRQKLFLSKRTGLIWPYLNSSSPTGIEGGVASGLLCAVQGFFEWAFGET